MSEQYSTEFDEQLNCAFVLSSSLYFRLVALDETVRRQRLWSWDDVLHDTTRDLAALSDATGTVDARIHQILSGISDLRHSLRDLAEIALRTGDQGLGDELQRRADRLDAQIANDLGQAR